MSRTSTVLAAMPEAGIEMETWRRGAPPKSDGEPIASAAETSAAHLARAIELLKAANLGIDCEAVSLLIEHYEWAHGKLLEVEGDVPADLERIAYIARWLVHEME